MDAGEDGIKQVNYWYVTGSGKKSATLITQNIILKS